MKLQKDSFRPCPLVCKANMIRGLSMLKPQISDRRSEITPISLFSKHL